AAPDLLELARCDIVERHHGLEIPVAGDEQLPVGAPLRVSDVDPVGSDRAHLATAGVDHPEVACHDPAVAAERLDDCDVVAGGRAARPAQLILRHVDVAAGASLRLDDGEASRVPERLARPRGDDSGDRIIAAPGGLPDIALTGAEPADAVLLEVVDPGTPPAVGLVPRIDARQPPRKVLHGRLGG